MILKDVAHVHGYFDPSQLHLVGPAAVQLRPWQAKANVPTQDPEEREGKGLSSAAVLSSSEFTNQVTPSASMEKRMAQEARKMPSCGILRSEKQVCPLLQDYYGPYNYKTALAEVFVSSVCHDVTVHQYLEHLFQDKRPTQTASPKITRISRKHQNSMKSVLC